MSTVEKKILLFIEKHLFVLALIGISLVAILIRFSYKDFISVDMRDFLLPWYEEIKGKGGFPALRDRVGNYNILYQTLIAFLTYIPVPPVAAYKLLSCLFDFACAVTGGCMICRLGKDKWKGLAGYALLLLSPVTGMNSALWGQCDSVYTFFLVLAVYMLMKEKYHVSFICLGFAFAFKLQAVFILPFFLFYYFYKRRFSIFHFLWMPAILFATSIPGLVMGRDWDECLSIYYSQTRWYRYQYMNYPSFWAVFSGSDNACYDMFSVAAICVTVTILAAIMVICLVRKMEISGENIIYLSLLLTYTCVLFLPAMHERYGYSYEIFAIILAVINRRGRWKAGALILISCVTYGHYLCGTDYNTQLFAAANVIVYACYLRDFFQAKSSVPNMASQDKS